MRSISDMRKMMDRIVMEESAGTEVDRQGRSASTINIYCQGNVIVVQPSGPVTIHRRPDGATSVEPAPGQQELPVGS